MGPRQEKWFYDQLSDSAARGATWRIIGNQIIFSRLNMSFALGEDTPLKYILCSGIILILCPF